MLHDGPVRVRYAPSPTGLQHIGGLRTALFNYLFARSNGGRFILRIEDTDRKRSENHYIQDLYESLKWLGIQVDEGPLPGGDYGPYVQSQRLRLYQKYTQQLLDESKAYYCFCRTERLEQLRNKQQQSKSPLQGYDRHCRNLEPQQAQAYRAAGQNPVVRFAIPLEESPTTVFHDLLLGDIQRANIDINPDPVILKADGFPTYHLANIIDDHLMQISHVLRAQEWLSSGPLHLLLYQALGWPPPQFCHLPMVMGPDGAKLSKRHGATSLIEFRKAGYLSEAIVNYISLLGWAFDDSREFFTLAELEQSFDLARISSSPATFNYQKLEWFNGQYIRQSSIRHLQEQLQSTWKQQLPQIYQPLPQNFTQSLEWILPLLQERLKLLNEAPALAAYFFARPQYLDSNLAIPKKHSVQQTLQLLQTGRSVLEQLCTLPWEWRDWNGLLAVKQGWESVFRSTATREGLKMGPLMGPLRYAITGSNASPPLIESMIILQRLAGNSELLTRLDQVAQLLSQLPD